MFPVHIGMLVVCLNAIRRMEYGASCLISKLALKLFLTAIDWLIGLLQSGEVLLCF